jgi:hypothetical protein
MKTFIGHTRLQAFTNRTPTNWELGPPSRIKGFRRALMTVRPVAKPYFLISLWPLVLSTPTPFSVANDALHEISLSVAT